MKLSKRRAISSCITIYVLCTPIITQAQSFQATASITNISFTVQNLDPTNEIAPYYSFIQTTDPKPSTFVDTAASGIPYVSIESADQAFGAATDTMTNSTGTYAYSATVTKNSLSASAYDIRNTGWGYAQAFVYAVPDPAYEGATVSKLILSPKSALTISADLFISAECVTSDSTCHGGADVFLDGVGAASMVDGHPLYAPDFDFTQGIKGSVEVGLYHETNCDSKTVLSAQQTLFNYTDEPISIYLRAGAEAFGNYTTAPVPELSSFWMTGIGIAVLGLFIRGKGRLV